MSEKNTPTPQEPAGTKKKNLIPTAIILALTSVGAYGIYTGNVTGWMNKGIDKVGNPSELFASNPSNQEALGQRGDGAPNLFPDDYEPTYADVETDGDHTRALSHSTPSPEQPKDQDDAASTTERERATTVDIGNTRYLDDLSQGHHPQEPGEADDTNMPWEADGATDDYQLDFGGSHNTSGDNTATSSSSLMDSATESQESVESTNTPIPEPEEIEAELTQILAERDSSSPIESVREEEPTHAPSSEVEALSAEERQQIIESPEFSGTIAAIGRRVGQSWQYEGDDYAEHGAIVKVHLADAGEAGDITISRSSGNDAYDASVLAAAQAAAPFHEVLELDDPAQALLTDFSLTFGSREAIEAWEAQWTVHEPDELQEEEDEEDPSYAAQVRRMIEAEWDRPDSFDADSEVSVQIRLAVPFGNVLAINLLRPSDDEAINESISEAIRAASPFDGIRQLPLAEQQQLQQFNLHFHAEGIR